MSEEKADRLNDRHEGKRHADRAGCACIFQLGDEEGICHIVKAGDEHTDDGGRGKPADELFRRLRRHAALFFLLFLGIGFHAMRHL